METFTRLESNVRLYCRKYPKVFTHARCATQLDEDGNSYVDFLSGAGALNYGHNEPRMRDAMIDYLSGDGVILSLDMHSAAKRSFIETFERLILTPRKLDYKMQFVGPTGTNAVEAAMKLARKVTGRRMIAAFTHGFHGMTLGSLAATGRGSSRRGAYTSLSDVIRLPYDGYFGPGLNTMELIRKYLTDPSSGFEVPAAFLLESVQGEGGLNVASSRWFEELVEFAREIGSLVILDEIQAGCGRCGTFFSFETMGAVPDMVCLSKSLSGSGLPMAMVLMRPDLDLWEPGEHTGTFRGNNLAFVSATTALECFWTGDALQRQIAAKSEQIRKRLEAISARIPGSRVKGRGLFLGIDMGRPESAAAVLAEAFARGLIIEVCGPHDEVLKLMPPLTISEPELAAGLSILEESITALELAKP